VRDVTGERRHKATRGDYVRLLRTRSFLFNVFAQTAMAFALGGLAFWFPAYLMFRNQPGSATAVFGGITALAGLIPRWQVDFWRTGCGRDLPVPIFSFPARDAAWLPAPDRHALHAVSIRVAPYVRRAVFYFLQRRPVEPVIANVSLPAVRATAFALNIS